ncbi:polyprenyl synthetase family protein [Streptomyces sp. Ru73]|uniref:polyprenyl synthetase family protein n=1 Tax=Streptomyces sp. Ru73 TaxID=2080748 RepID=UPI00215618B7|nr:polyprenyl synthetase family protein [Streptomyces sp. Ru73]
MSALSSMAAASPAVPSATEGGIGGPATGGADSSATGGADAALFGWARELVTPALRRVVADLPGPQREIARYHRGWGAGAESTAGGGGKAVRPALVFLSAMAVGAPPESVVPGAVAVELVHDFSLLHDDVIDADPLRRHRPAVWRQYGTPAAVLTGDALLISALAVLAADATPHAAAATRELSGMLEDLLRGQSQDVAFESTARVRAEEYLEMAAGKTGALMGCACALGALLAGASEARTAGLRDFGRHLGVAFQCVDDLLGIWGSTRRSGKPVGADVAARKKSLPVTVALADTGPAGRRLAALYDRTEPLSAADVATATELIEQAGGREATEVEARRQVGAAMRALARAEPVPSVYRQLHDLALLMTRRDH